MSAVIKPLFVPRQDVELVDGARRGSAEFRQFLLNLVGILQATGVDPAVIADIYARIEALEAASGTSFTMSGVDSVAVDGTPAGGVVQVHLLNDVFEPGNSYFYGTGQDGVKGYFTAESTVAGADSVAKTVALTGVSTFRLVNDVPTPDPMNSYSTDAAGVRGWYRPALFESCGVIDGGGLSIGTPNTTFSIAAGIVGFSDWAITPVQPTRRVAAFPAMTNIATFGLTTAIATYVGLQYLSPTSVTVVQQTTPFTNAQRRTIAQIGVVIHSNLVNNNAINDQAATVRAGINQLGDLMSAIGILNTEGNVVGANGANLNINKTAGKLFKLGCNFQIDHNNPHLISLAALTAPSNIRYRLSNGTEFADTAVIDPFNYESAPGVRSALSGGNRFSAQRIALFQSNLIRIQYGQTDYPSMAAAEEALNTEPFSVESNIRENGIFIGYLILRRSTTNLTVAGDAKFIPTTKFGAPSAGAAALTATAILTALGAPKVVTGSRGGNAALASLLTGLASLGLVTDSTTP